MIVCVISFAVSSLIGFVKNLNLGGKFLSAVWLGNSVE